MPVGGCLKLNKRRMYGVLHHDGIFNIGNIIYNNLVYMGT